MRQLCIILTILTAMTSCYKDEQEIQPFREDNDTAEFSIIGGGFNEIIRSNRTYQSIFADPSIGLKDGTYLVINNEKSPEINIYLDNYRTGTYNIDGFKNRAYLNTTSFLGDALSGQVVIKEQTDWIHFAGSYNLTFRNNSINSSDTIFVIGTYIADQ